MPRVHDRGGWPGASSIDKTEHKHSIWEQRIDALMVLLTRPEKRVMRVDELRRAIESFTPSDYENLSYYERWVKAIEALMIEKGILTREEVDRRVKEREASGG